MSTVAALRHRLALAAVVALSTVATPAAAQLVNENLLVTVPKGFKAGHQARNGQQAINEFVPAGETVDNWSEMVTVQIFFNRRDLSPAQFRARIESGWTKACSGGAAQSVSAAPENGYPALMWKLTCPRNPATGKPENTWFKAIAGQDSFYVVQKAFRSEPTAQQAGEAMAYLNKISVCDSRRKDRPCSLGRP